MTAMETNDLFFVMGALYPESKGFINAEPEVVEVWAIMLADLTYKEAEAAVRKHASVSPYAPKVADIIGQSVNIKNPQLDADQAWGLVQKAIRKHHRCGKEKAKSDLPSAVWETVERLGWQELCTTENIEVARGQFMKMYGIQAKREQEKAALPPAVRKLIGQIEVKRLDA